MKRFAGWLFSSLGYALYTVAVVLVLLWVLFPVDSFRVWLQARMNTAGPARQWEIGAMRKAWPLSVVAADIRLREGGGAPQPLVRIDEVRIRPDFGGLIAGSGNIPVHYQVSALQGSVRGNMSFMPAGNRIQCRGDLENLEVEGLGEIWRIMNREAAGSLSGRFSFEGPWDNLPQGSGQAELVITDGSIALIQPFFGLSRLEFSRMTTALKFGEGVVAVEEGTVESKMLAGEYGGTVTLADSLPTSEVKIDGFIEPRPELLGSIKDGATLALIRNQLRENRLSFAISGTILEPGITFQGASGVIDGILRGGAQ